MVALGVRCLSEVAPRPARSPAPLRELHLRKTMQDEMGERASQLHSELGGMAQGLGEMKEQMDESFGQESMVCMKIDQQPMKFAGYPLVWVECTC